MDDAGALDKQRLARSKVAMKNEHELFVLEGIDDEEDPVKGNKKDRSDIKHKFFLGLALRAQVPPEHRWYVYRNGLLYKKLSTGLYVLWNWCNFLTKWQVRRINLRTVLLPALAYGRVRGPELPQGSERGANLDLALNVGAEFRLLCRIVNIEKFLSYELPLKVFYASFNNIVQERISQLPYDQYGKWASLLCRNVEEDLQVGRDNTEQLIGVRIERVFVDSFASSDEHDTEVLKLYQLTETVKRELETAISLGKQGELLDIAPSILALQNNEIGRELIRHDARLREMMIAVGMRPGGMLPIPGTHIVESTQHFGYLSPPPSHSRQLPPVPPNPFSGPWNGGNTGPFSGPLPRTSPDGDIAQFSGPLPWTPPTSPDLGRPQPPPYTPGPSEPSDPLYSTPSNTSAMRQRQEMDKEKLRLAGFDTNGWGPLGTFDSMGNSGNIKWSLTVTIQRENGYLVILFQCAHDYPSTAPTVQVRTSHQGLQELWPKAITEWRPENSLVEVVQEIAQTIAAD
ncbi:MAG TPA: hypothetical protein VEL31_31650 [Ktedonobacteraceae bacterium]|nr:hypothetical protein [Ktedonobacteraceae bacterium]